MFPRKTPCCLHDVTSFESRDATLISHAGARMATEIPVKLSDILRAHQRIAKCIHKTPVFTSSTADSITRRKLFFKAENLQKTGSFKARGALNSVR